MTAKAHSDPSQNVDSEGGFTLLEMVIAVVLLVLITGAISAAFISSLNATAATKTRVNETNDAQLIAGFFTRDAQAAGGINPATASVYPNVGVTAPAANGCSPTTPGPLVLIKPIIGFEWIDLSSGTTYDSTYSYVTPAGATPVPATYQYQPQELLRTVCSTTPATPPTKSIGTSVLANNIVTKATGALLPPSAGCNTPTNSCPSGASYPPTTTTVYMTMSDYTTASATTPYTFTLSASLRPQSGEPAPIITANALAPLLALGGVGCTNGTTGFDDGGTNLPVTVYGQININATDSGGCPAMYVHGNTQPTSGTVSILNNGTCSGCSTAPSNYTTPIVDPYKSTLQPLAAGCAGASQPSGNSFTNTGGNPLIFPNAFTPGSSVSFAAGTYVFCQGLTAGTISTPPLTQPGVIFYIVNSLPAGTPYACTGSGYGLALNGNANVSINGLVYAPTSIIGLCGNGTFKATSVVAGALSVQGTIQVTIGVPPAANALSLSNQSGGSYLSGTNAYYRGAVAGSFTITNALTDPGGPGPASSTFAALAGTTTGWTHVASTVSTPTGGPYVSTPFSWTATTTSSPTELVTGADIWGIPNAGTTLTFVNDNTAPTGGALTVNGTVATPGGTTSTNTTGSFTIGTRTNYNADTGSGFASSILTVQSETLIGRTNCGAAGSGGPFTSPTTVTGTSQPVGIVTGFCYVYTLTGTDNVGNSTSLRTTVIVPVPTALTVSPVSGPTGRTGVTLSGTGYNAGATVNATTGVTFGGSPLAISGTQTVAADGTWSATFTVPSGTFGPKTITATDSGGASASTTFTLGFAGIDWSNTISTGTIGACNYTTITAVACTATSAGSNGTFQASVRLIDANHNTVNNPTGSTITVTQVTTGQGSTVTTAPVTILNGASTTPGTFKLTLNNGGNKTATIKASITVNSVTYNVSLTLSN